MLNATQEIHKFRACRSKDRIIDGVYHIQQSLQQRSENEGQQRQKQLFIQRMHDRYKTILKNPALDILYKNLRDALLLSVYDHSSSDDAKSATPSARYAWREIYAETMQIYYHILQQITNNNLHIFGYDNMRIVAMLPDNIFIFLTWYNPETGVNIDNDNYTREVQHTFNILSANGGHIAIGFHKEGEKTVPLLDFAILFENRLSQLLPLFFDALHNQMLAPLMDIILLYYIGF